MKALSRYWAVCLLLALALRGTPLAAAAGADKPPDLTDLSIEQLMNVEVTSASKRQQPVSDIAGAVYVITQEDIHRSGAVTIADALRLAPGLTVAKINANQWAITARGFNSHFGNKLLVLVDGRSVYSPLFSGVYWDSLDAILPDVDRIEVIRGPGAALWGANAVNGLINIITKDARQTTGGLITSNAGTELRGQGAARYGGQIGDQFGYRVFGKYVDTATSTLPSGGEADDDWQVAHAGFRADGKVSGETLTLDGDVYDNHIDQRVAEPMLTPPFSRTVGDQMEAVGGHLLGRWTHRLSGGNETSLQGYFDRLERDQFGITEDRRTYDLDFQHRLAAGAHQEIVWGAGFRDVLTSLTGTFFVSFDPERRTDHLFSLFAQDTVALAGGDVHVVFGSRFEHNDYTGFEIQPDLRLIWKTGGTQWLWAAVSRAVRTPNRADQDVRANLAAFPTLLGIPGVAAVLGSRDLDSEQLLAYEAGWRWRPSQAFFLDLALFSESYRDLIGGVPATPFVETNPPPPHLVIPQIEANRPNGTLRGGEVTATWRATKRWSLTGWYSYLMFNVRPERGINGNDPRAQAQVRSYLDLPHGFSLDTTVHFTGSLPAQQIGGWIGLDTRIAWRASDRLELSLVGQNLAKARQAQFAGAFSLTEPTEIQRGVYASVVWRF